MLRYGCKHVFHVFPYFFGVKQWIFLKMEKISRDTLISTINTKFELPNPSRCWDMAANTFFRIFFGVKQWNFVKMEKNSGDTLISTIHTKFELPNPSRCWDMAANTFFTFFPYFFGAKQWNFLKMEKNSPDTLVIVRGLFTWFRVNPVLEYICFFIAYIVNRVPWDLESECWLLNILEQFFLQTVFENVKISIFDFFHKILKNKISLTTRFLKATPLEISIENTK